ncbi:unnamed protein product [Closterium sp. NIES-64]|nr:unnamed protein product [Closterium sp. NIES-64]
MEERWRGEKMRACGGGGAAGPGVGEGGGQGYLSGESLVRSAKERAEGGKGRSDHAEESERAAWGMLGSVIKMIACLHAAMHMRGALPSLFLSVLAASHTLEQAEKKDIVGVQEQACVHKVIELRDKYLQHGNHGFLNHSLFHKGEQALKEAFETCCSKGVGGSTSASCWRRAAGNSPLCSTRAAARSSATRPSNTLEQVQAQEGGGGGGGVQREGGEEGVLLRLEEARSTRRTPSSPAAMGGAGAGGAGSGGAGMVCDGALGNDLPLFNHHKGTPLNVHPPQRAVPPISITTTHQLHSHLHSFSDVPVRVCNNMCGMACVAMHLACEQADAIIVDEASMLDVPLVAALLAACPQLCRILFVGDKDQLPPVGPGNFLAHITGCMLPAPCAISHVPRALHPLSSLCFFSSLQ